MADRWSIPRLWPGDTIVVVAGGPSLRPADVDYCRGRARTIVVNDGYTLAPWADVLYACDGAWWEWHHGATSFAGLKVAGTRHGAKWPGVHCLVVTSDRGLADDPSTLCGNNGGHHAINLAAHLGAGRLILLGFDMQVGSVGQSHWFGEHPNRVQPNLELFRETMPSLAAPLRARGIDVLNCSPETALTCFPRADLRDVL